VPTDITVDDVMRHVGPKCPVEVMNAATQGSESWTMSQWVQYYNSPRNKRDKVRSSISIEIWCGLWIAKWAI